MMIVNARRPLALLSCLALAGSLVAAPGERPKRLAVEPNAIVQIDDPLTIEVEGVPAGDPVKLEVFEDCLDKAACPAAYTRPSEPADAKGIVRDKLYRSELVAGDMKSPEGRRLWLRVSFQDSERYRQAMFGFGVSECDLFATFFDAFRLGPCDPGLLQVLRNHRQPSDLADQIFEVRRITTDAVDADPITVPGTRGASGVAWWDAQTLLVTAAGTEQEGDLPAGLYSVRLGGDAQPERLWVPDADQPPPSAPFALSDKRVAFVTQAPGAQGSEASETVAHLVVWDKELGEVSSVGLPYKVHQVLRSGADGNQLLALSLGVADNRPTLLSVDLETRETTVLGFSNALYEAALREPEGEVSVVAFENAFALNGWEMVLTREGQLERILVKRNGKDDLAPAWNPRGGEVAFLSQVGTEY